MIREKLPTFVLRITSILSAVACVPVCVFALPSFGSAVAEHYPKYAFLRIPALIGLYAAAGCFFFALFHLWLLLNSVDKNKTLPIKNLRAIRVSAIVFSILYFVSAMPIIFLAAQADDAPGLILVGAFLDAFPISVAAIAGILEQSAGK